MTGERAVVGWRCAACGADVDIRDPAPWCCPRATDVDRRHVLRPVGDGSSGAWPTQALDGSTPFHRYDHELAWAAFAAAHGMGAAQRGDLVAELDDAVAGVAGTGFRRTPLARSSMLSDELGFSDRGGVWVKDETGGVGGSQKARHLFTILLQLVAAERLGLAGRRARLAIASCGNAALAAAILARAAARPIDVFVPTWMSDAFGAELERIGATIHRCERRSSDPPGDPAMLRFREAVRAGAIPFTVQGPENALALDGGRTIGWEICEQLGESGVDRVDGVFVQVGGGAFATCVGSAVAAHCPAPLHAVQAEGCAPLARAWERAGADVADPVTLAVRWSELMTPWDRPRSLADGILDDETYDWLGVVTAMSATGGSPVVAAESDVVAAHDLARRAGYPVSATGSAGLAGVLATVERWGADDRVVVVMSGVAR